MRRFFYYFLFGALFFAACGTPNDPEEITGGNGGYKIISKTVTSGYAQDVIVEDSLAYIAQGEGGLMIINISDPAAPAILTTVSDELKGYSFKLTKKDSAIYLACGNFGVSVVNVADPFNPVVTVTNLSIKPARDLIVHGEYLLTTVSELGVSISQISYRTQPDIRGTMIAPGYARGLCTSPDSNYLLISCGEMGFTMLDISDMQNGYGFYPKAGWVDTRGYAMDIVCHPVDPIAYLACGTGGLVIVDYSDTSDVKVVGSYSTGGYAKEIIYEEGLIYLTTETRGLQVFNVSDVTSPKKIGSVNTKYAMGIFLDEKYIYIADELEGLIIIEKK